MNSETVKEALQAEGTERIECPVCGDEIPAFELATDHAHSQALLKTILELLGRPRPAGPNDDYHREGSDKLRETIIRYDPENVMSDELHERLREIDAAETEEQTQSIPERRVFGVGSKADYERISEAVWGVANAFVGSSLHAGHELVACPDCGYEGHVDQAVFPGGTDHYSDAEKAGEEEDG
jgi:predicted RNA-binding Zn-ribbon protein involved in translation (DUF1610 family)